MAASARVAAELAVLFEVFTRSIDTLLQVIDRRALVDHDARGSLFLTSTQQSPLALILFPPLPTTFAYYGDSDKNLINT
jgi:hypothetical protein